jgi:hypothetical protein
MRLNLLPSLMILAAASPVPAQDTCAYVENGSQATWRYKALGTAPVMLVVQDAVLEEAPYRTRFLEPGEPCAGSIAPGERLTLQVAALGDLALDLPFALIDDRGGRRPFVYRVRKSVDYQADTLEAQGRIGAGGSFKMLGSSFLMTRPKVWDSSLVLLEDRFPAPPPAPPRLGPPPPPVLPRLGPSPIRSARSADRDPGGASRPHLPEPMAALTVKGQPVEIGDPRVEPAYPDQDKASMPPEVYSCDLQLLR